MSSLVLYLLLALAVTIKHTYLTDLKLGIKIRMSKNSAAAS